MASLLILFCPSGLNRNALGDCFGPSQGGSPLNSIRLALLLGISLFAAQSHVAVAQDAKIKNVAAANVVTAARSHAEQDKLYAALRIETAELQRFSVVLNKVAKLIRPTVVHIDARKLSSEEAGSGVIIQIGGKHYVLTNRHVISDTPNNRIKIKLADGRRIHPYRQWSDPETDVAVLAISAKDLVAARFGDSDKLKVGDFVLAMGSPFGLSHSVSFGIVSAKDRRNLTLGEQGVKYQDFIQTDAAINPGNSGGPLVNLRGEVVGINTAIASNSGRNEGIGFSVPVNMVAVVATQLVKNGKVQRAYLGVTLDSTYSRAKAAALGLPRRVGALVLRVEVNTPAEAAKIHKDDVILSFNGKAIEDDAHLINVVGVTPIGKEVAIVIFRAKKKIMLRLKIGNRSDYAIPATRG